MKSPKDQLIDVIIDDYLVQLVTYCVKEAEGSNDERQAFKDALSYQIQARLHETSSLYNRIKGSSHSIR